MEATWKEPDSSILETRPRLTMRLSLRLRHLRLNAVSLQLLEEHPKSKLFVSSLILLANQLTANVQSVMHTPCIAL